ncbi:DUF3152 domain-containing protein [Streptomyces sp. WI04-05B]|uniref:DUF3152 domain-containing protein n=1 Tax=Streptomyces TaxID=1883 RepID=UPI0029ACFBDA|nr:MULTISPECIES: DUF3152 domain-containing protein [unclassified Streptomyces]MDX2543882.1 DUF3152 domain-containing protein [Streptomyces sp. WI04-05B]MDX2584408.1 DUF3152 domain-containing protein [Streptomyces sp. WI04-05A]MDX3753308.1 DUF3152 domain-containing protein [Streptomyces sp. AK08-02]
MTEQRRAIRGSRRLTALRRRRRRRTRIGAIGATVCLAALGTAAVPVLLPRLLPDTASRSRSPEAARTPAQPTPGAGADGTSRPPDDSTAGAAPEPSGSPKSPGGKGTSGSGKGPGKGAGSGSSSQPAIPASGPGTFETAPLTVTGPASGTPFRVQVEDGAGVDPADAARQIGVILGDRRGWGRAGARFRQVTGPEAELTFRVATAATTDKLCDVRQADHKGEVNCRTGADVVINLKRWQLGSPEFDGPPVEYRALIVNHEVGHWLGRGHETCPGPGRPAPAMMQQIDGLKGCVSNPWPYDTRGRYLSGPAVP